MYLYIGNKEVALEVDTHHVRDNLRDQEDTDDNTHRKLNNCF